MSPGAQTHRLWEASHLWQLRLSCLPGSSVTACNSHLPESSHPERDVGIPWEPGVSPALGAAKIGEPPANQSLSPTADAVRWALCCALIPGAGRVGTRGFLGQRQHAAMRLCMRVCLCLCHAARSPERQRQMPFRQLSLRIRTIPALLREDCAKHCGSIGQVQQRH